MTELHRVSDGGADAAADVIFVHGLGGDAFATWWHDDAQPKELFPFWLAHDCPGLAAHTLAYDASPSKWLGASMPLVDRATNVLTRLEVEGIGGRPLFFVCHSLGGLVVKQTLRSALELGESNWRQIVHNTRGIVFLATPHTGARLADYLGALGSILRLSVTMGELEASAPALRDLNVWYRQKATDLSIETFALFETRDTHGVRVVDEASDDPGQGVPRAVDADHFSICKPQARSDLTYGAVRNFIGRRLPNAREEPTKASDGGRRSKYFISYSRRSEEDGRLADALQAGLESAGHEVFIDRGMRVGTDWGEEIGRRIEWCDYLVVLLSATSVHSEMVLGEVRTAHRKLRQDGRPQLLPVRVRYNAPFDYELDSYLARFQYLTWGGAGDTSHVLAEIAAIGSPNALRQAAEAPGPFAPQTTEEDAGRPQSSEDMRGLFPPPGGNIKLNDEFYVTRRIDAVVQAAAGRPGETLCIKAPRQFGKSSLLIRYLARCAEAGKRFALVDFQSFTDGELANYATLLTRLAEQILRALGLNASSPPEIRTQAELTNFLEDAIFPQITTPLTLAFDEVDRVLGRSYQSDFFGMVRLWHNRRAEPLSRWEQVDVALVIATEPYLLIDSRDRSPFNVAIPIEPKAFARPALDGLNARYRGNLTSTELDDLHELIAGHPFLTRLAFYRLATEEGLSFAALERTAAHPYGPFGDHLRAMLVLLQHHEGLLAAMRQVISNGSVRDDETYYRLHGAGLAERDNRRVKPSNLLYARFFKELR